jgi:hypothetical protein
MTEVRPLNRFLLNAAAAAIFVVSPVAATAAEPVKAPAEQADAPSRPAQVLLASSDIPGAGDQAATVQSDGQASEPAKRPRARRVTTCRCAGQLPEPNQQ